MCRAAHSTISHSLEERENALVSLWKAVGPKALCQPIVSITSAGVAEVKRPSVAGLCDELPLAPRREGFETLENVSEAPLARAGDEFQALLATLH
jgi:hypothetical protein